MLRNNLHISLALLASLSLVACGEKGGDTGDTGMNFAGGNGTSGDYADDQDDGNDDIYDHNMAPTVVISSPADGEIFEQGDEITFYATVSDDSDTASMIELLWQSDMDGDLNDDPAGDNDISFSIDSLTPGRHVISLEAMDTEGELSSTTVMITIEADGTNDDDDDVDDDVDDDPVTEDDQDGDGYTIEDGDCNDNDWYTYPGADEYCDGEDNDCDGEADEDYWDDYEYNNVLGAATDLGEIDRDGVITSATGIDLEGLSLHNADDEDWFRFDADDDYYDDVDIYVVYSGSEEVEVTMQLFKLDWDTTIPWEEVTGTGELTLEEGGSIWTDDEDDWAVRILPASDDTISCDTTYSLHIEA